MLQDLNAPEVDLSTLTFSEKNNEELSRDEFVDLVKNEDLRAPIGIDLAVQAHPNPAQVLSSGELLGQMMIEVARRYNLPFAFSRMDLAQEKETLLEILGVPEGERESFQFKTAPGEAAMKEVEEGLRGPVNARLQVQLDAIRYVREHSDIIPIGSVIGPFSGTTKLLPDPITPTFLYGEGMRSPDDPDVATLMEAGSMMRKVIERSIQLQIEAGAGGVFIAEPAAQKSFISPNQIADGSSVFDDLVVEPGMAIRRQLEGEGALMFFHCCGEINDQMLDGFIKMHPDLLSLGSSRVLWEDAAKVPDDIVLYGNLPTKTFFQRDAIAVGQVKEMARRLHTEMHKTGHPFILGSECDVLSVPGAEEEIAKKVDALVHFEWWQGAGSYMHSFARMLRKYLQALKRTFD